MRLLAVLLLCSVGVPGCAREPEPDAYGNVEAVAVTVSAEAAGQLLMFDVVEGQVLQQGQLIGAIDAAGVTLEREQVVAQREATSARIAEVDRQIDVLEAQRQALDAQRSAAAAQRAALVVTRDVAQRTYDRIAMLLTQQAATVQQRDQAEREWKTAEEQIRAQDEQIKAIERQLEAQVAQIAAVRAQRVSTQRQVAAVDAQVARAAERVGKAEVRNPTDGTVLVTFARAGEVVQPGQPLYRIADLRRVDVRAYIAETQLAAVRTGQTARVTFDRGGTRESIDATVTWIASQAEFTPTPIQTRDERTDLVYAIKLSAANENGLLKIGMPVDVSFATATP